MVFFLKQTEFEERVERKKKTDDKSSLKCACQATGTAPFCFTHSSESIFIRSADPEIAAVHLDN